MLLPVDGAPFSMFLGHRQDKGWFAIETSPPACRYQPDTTSLREPYVSSWSHCHSRSGQIIISDHNLTALTVTELFARAACQGLRQSPKQNLQNQLDTGTFLKPHAVCVFRKVVNLFQRNSITNTGVSAVIYCCQTSKAKKRKHNHDAGQGIDDSLTTHGQEEHLPTKQ